MKRGTQVAKLVLALAAIFFFSGLTAAEGRLTSDADLRSQVNLNGHAVNYPLAWWATVPLVTDLAVSRSQTPGPAARYQQVLETLQVQQPPPLVGTYISGGRVLSTNDHYPAETVEAVQVPADWFWLGSDRIDLGRLEVRRGFAELIAATVAGRSGQIVFLDNIVHPSAWSEWVPWVDTVDFLQDLRQRLRTAANKLLITNIAVVPWALTDEDARLISEAVDGMSFEMPFHQFARGHQARTERAIAVYRSWLDQGKMVVLIPVVSVQADSEVESRLMAGLAMAIRQPGDSLFVSTPFWRPPSDWSNWPATYGRPLTPPQVAADGIITRDFERGTLRVDSVNRLVDWTIPSPDTTPPSVPVNLTPTVISSSQINLHWSSSIDPVVSGQITSGLKGYRLYRNSSKIADLTGVTYQDAGLTANTTYQYAVAAYDLANNFSSRSAIVTVTTPPAAVYTLNLITAGTGSGLTSRNPNQTAYPAGTVVTITATPTNGSTFTGWSGSRVSTTNPVTVTMNSNMNVYANFTAAAPPPPTATPSLTVTSPTNNSSWTASNGPVIQWSSVNIPSGNQVTVELLTPSNGSVPGFSTFTTGNDGSESGRLTNSSVVSGSYYFRLKTTVNGQTIYGGSGVFQFIGSTQAPPPPDFTPPPPPIEPPPPPPPPPLVSPPSAAAQIVELQARIAELKKILISLLRRRVEQLILLLNLLLGR